MKLQVLVVITLVVAAVAVIPLPPILEKLYLKKVLTDTPNLLLSHILPPIDIDSQEGCFPDCSKGRRFDDSCEHDSCDCNKKPLLPDMLMKHFG